MAIKKSGGLGRGLGSILPDIADLEPVAKKSNAAVSMIEVGLVDPNPFQPRKEFIDSELEELAQSIKQQGVITPVTLRQMPDGRYQLVAGERRLRASKLAGLKEIPAYVRTATDIQMMEMALVENIQRSDLNAIEVAQAYHQLIDECRLTQDQLSERVGKDRSTISNYLRLLGLPAETQEALALQENFVVNKEALRKAGMAAADHFNDPYYDDVYSRSSNGQLKENRYRFSKKNIDDLENIILSCSCMHSEDQAVSIILIEEMPAYFKDQKSLEDVIKIAQDRAQKVLDERK